ncbi:hypothetical protein [Pengzhenrongella frigida]|uniref:LPXTG cell wall anchor domain-containing protein n=1 Tax=Pengzhenrongella frigida TaxID=1259133 RepID=A0A4Q5MWH0_9MICO|nr:hypothetical protein [Cellulomonas sp. HLT2-17]RYV49920.1 hypothetical protein EUA98_16240 [Cellulomonas sp. HLT2-17]
MRHLARSLAALTLGTASVFVAGLPASAQDEACTEQDTGYGASGVCVVEVLQADPICPAGVLQLTYQVTAEGTEATTVDLRWINPGGTDVVQTGQPFSGTVDWPASIPTRATDVEFRVGTELAVNVDPKVALAKCLPSGSKVLSVSDTTSSASTGSSGVLAFTGSEALPFAVAGGGLLLAGTALVLVRSARARRAVQ